jgi:CRISPR-associated protein Cas2
MADKPRLRVVTYDISDNRRRRKVAELLEERAVRVQESVFEARLNDRQAQILMAALGKATGKGDSIRLYTVPDPALADCRTDGGPAILDGARYWLL